MPKTLSAYFLCAGYGRRLQPLTDRIPKPAIPFLGRTALEINFRQSQVLAPSRFLCNTHHLYEKMEKPAHKLGMDVLYEREILGTGGCLWNARHILEDTDRFLVHNGDLIHTIELQDLLNRHIASGNIATLAGIFRPVHNTLSVNGAGNLLGVHGFEGYASTSSETTRLTFAGIAIYERNFLAYLKPGCQDIKPYWTQALKAGHSIGIVNYSQVASWYDFGTPQGLWEAAKFYMELNKEFSYGYANPVREVRPYVSNEAGVEDLPEALRDLLIYEEPIKLISPNTQHKIIGRDFAWDFKP
jgi:mannose-1-phosphate guanylyltransferase